MYAIIESGSHQYRVQEGDQLTIDKQNADEGDTLNFDNVLLVAGTEDDPQIGTPYVDGARVVGEVVRNFRGKKIIVQKFKRRKNYRRKKGHRQPYTTVQITEIQTP